jgi:hypothetical protein
VVGSSKCGRFGTLEKRAAIQFQTKTANYMSLSMSCLVVGSSKCGRWGTLAKGLQHNFKPNLPTQSGNKWKTPSQ